MQDQVGRVSGVKGHVGDGRVPLQPEGVEPLSLQGPAPLRVLLLLQGELQDLHRTNVTEPAAPAEPTEPGEEPTCWSAWTETRLLPVGWTETAVGQEPYTGTEQWSCGPTETGQVLDQQTGQVLTRVNLDQPSSCGG